MIISGERRWRAAQKAGLTEIECCFREAELSSSEILEEQLIENCLREDLQPIEEAQAFAALMRLNSWTGKEVAKALRVHPSRVSRALALLKLPEEIQEQVNTGEIPARSAYFNYRSSLGVENADIAAEEEVQGDRSQQNQAGHRPCDSTTKGRVRSRSGERGDGCFFMDYGSVAW